MARRDRAYVPTKEAAAILRTSQPTIAHGLQQGRFPFGAAIKNARGGYTYIIYRKELLAFAREKGITTPEPEGPGEDK